MRDRFPDQADHVMHARLQIGIAWMVNVRPD
jgi:hypothetical protein